MRIASDGDGWDGAGTGGGRKHTTHTNGLVAHCMQQSRERQDISMPAAIGQAHMLVLCSGARGAACERVVLSPGEDVPNREVGKTGWRMGGAWWSIWCLGWGGMSQGGVWQNTKCTPPTKGCGNTAPLRGGSPKDAASDPFCRRKWPGDERGKQRALAARGAAVGGRYWPCARAAAIKRTRKQCIALGRGVVGAGAQRNVGQLPGAARERGKRGGGKEGKETQGNPKTGGLQTRERPTCRPGCQQRRCTGGTKGGSVRHKTVDRGRACVHGGTGGISMQRGGKGGGQNSAGGADRGDQITA